MFCNAFPECIYILFSNEVYHYYYVMHFYISETLYISETYIRFMRYCRCDLWLLAFAKDDGIIFETQTSKMRTKKDRLRRTKFEIVSSFSTEFSISIVKLTECADI